MLNQKSTINHQPSNLIASILWVAGVLTAAIVLGTLIMNVASAEVNSEVCAISYDGNSSTKTFTFPFGILATSQLRVVVRTVATGAESLLVLNSGYSMTDDDADGDYTDGPGGSITTLAADAYSSAYEIHLSRKPALTQTRDLDGTYYVRLATLEDAVDNLTYEVQYLRRLLYRVPMIPETEAQVTDMNLPASGTSGYLFRETGGDIALGTPLALTDANVSTFWRTRLENDSNAAEARTALDAQAADPNLDDAADRTFNHGLIVTNGAISSGYVAIQEDSDSGSSYMRILVPPLQSNADWTWPAIPSDGWMKVSVTGQLSVDTPAGAGDMEQATYDNDSNDIVDLAELATNVADANYGDVNVVSGVWHADNLVGPLVSKSNNTIYQAATAGLVHAVSPLNPSVIVGYVGSSSPPTTVLMRSTRGYSVYQVGITMAVAKGEYWKVTGATTVYWRRLGQ